MAPRVPFNSVRVRLALWNVGVLAFVLVSLGIAFSLTIRANIAAAVDLRLSQRAHHAQHFFANPPPPPPGNPPHDPNDTDSHDHFLNEGPPHDNPPPEPHDADDPLGELHPRFFDVQGNALRPQGKTPWGNASDDPNASIPWDRAGMGHAQQGGEAYATVHDATGEVRVFSLPLYRNGQIIGVVQMGNSLTHIHDEQARMTRTLLTLIPFVLLIAGLGGAFLTDRALRPVRRIAAAAGKIEAGNLSRRLPVTGHDEFADLAETFNSMLARLQVAFERQEQAFEQQRRFTADASHELRTPLTIIKANTSLALSMQGTVTDYQKTLRAVDSAADRMTRLVQDLLLLARSDAEQLSYHLEPTPLAEILTQSAALPVLDHAPITVDLPVPPPWVLGHTDTLIRLFGNLLENAARHTPPEGQIIVSASRQEEAVTISVTDTGEGIAPEHLPHVTERFYRIEAARSRAHGGTGLGLSICQSIVEAHGGTLEIESVLGQGTTVRVTLQRAARVWEEPTLEPAVLLEREAV